MQLLPHKDQYFSSCYLDGLRVYLLESDVQVEGQRLSGIADRRDGVLQTGRGGTGEQLNSVRAGVVAHLKVKSHPVRIQPPKLKEKINKNNKRQ